MVQRIHKGLTVGESILSSRPTIDKSNVDYESLYRRAMQHLKEVSGSRNSFTPEVNRLIYKASRSIDLRTPGVEAMHHEAVDFLFEQRRLGLFG